MRWKEAGAVMARDRRLPVLFDLSSVFVAVLQMPLEAGSPG
jgi:hypothetical protein